MPSAQAPNPLQRVPIDFRHERLADKLAPWAGTRGAVVVMEGVSMYLRDEQMQETTETLRRLLPEHLLLCDLVSATFERRYGGPIRREIQLLGGDFAPLHDDPAGFVQTLGYRHLDDASIVGRAVEHGSLMMPYWIFNSLFRSLRDGYRVYAFESRD